MRLVIDADVPEGSAPTVLELTITDRITELGQSPDDSQSGEWRPWSQQVVSAPKD